MNEGKGIVTLSVVRKNKVQNEFKDVLPFRSMIFFEKAEAEEAKELFCNLTGIDKNFLIISEEKWLLNERLLKSLRRAKYLIEDWKMIEKQWFGHDVKKSLKK